MTVATTTRQTPADSRLPTEPPRAGRGLAQSTSRGRVVVLLVAVVALAAVALLSVLVGNFSVSLADVFGAVAGEPANDVERVVRHLRIPRTMTGLLAGAALGVAGVVMQGLTRNPLAEPGLLGISSGAALAVVVAMSVLDVSSTSGYVWFAFAGAAIAALFVYTLGSFGLGGATPVKLALAGAAFTALIGSLTTVISFLDPSTLDDLRFWVVGSLIRADPPALAAVTPFVFVGVLAAFATTRHLNVLALGDDIAQTLGTRLWWTRGLTALSVVLLAGSATAVAGPVGFIGLVVPHVARMLVGTDYRWVMALTIVLAPALLLLADIVGRVVVQPQQLQVGIVTALIGAPFFLYLVRRRTVAGL